MSSAKGAWTAGAVRAARTVGKAETRLPTVSETASMWCAIQGLNL